LKSGICRKKSFTHKKKAQEEKIRKIKKGAAAILYNS
jgi:hypothetical protein